MARKTISQRIALEGGKEIKDELKGLGAAGEAAFKQIADAAEATEGLGANFGRAMAKLRDDLGRVRKAGSDLNGSLTDLASAAGTAAGRITKAGAAISSAAAGFLLFVRFGTQLADVQNKAAQAAGLPIEAFGRLSFAADQSGVSADQLRTGLAILNRTLGAAADGNDAAAEKFRQLGVTIKGANGELRPTEEIIKDIADRIGALPDGAEKSALAIGLFGEAGAKLIPLLNGTSTGIEELGAQAERLGIVFTKEQAVVAEAMNDALSALNRARQGVQSQLALLFAPTITEAARGLTDVITENRQALLDLAERGLAVAVPLVRDFVNALVGNDAAVSSQWILDARDAVIGFGQAVVAVVTGLVIPAWNLLQAAADAVAGAVNSIFGTEFTGQELIVAAFVAKILGLFALIGPAILVVVNTVKLLIVTFAALPAAAGVVSAAFALISGAATTLLTGLAAVIGWPALLVAAFAAAVTLIVVYWDEIKAAASAAFDFIADLFGSAGDWLAAGFRSQVDQVVDLFARIRDAASAIWADLQSGFAKTWETIERTAQRFVDRLTAQLRRLRDAFRELESRNRDRASETTARQQAFASGGYVRGPGSGTSDSILARLSNGEFVIKAAAVRHYGPQLLAALNSMRLPKGGLPGFNAGGLVSALTAGMSQGLPRYATGGLVAVPAGGGRPINLTIDGQTISGLTASPQAVEQIERFTTSRLVRSTGRRPGWMGA